MRWNRLGSDQASNIAGKQWNDVHNNIFLADDKSWAEIERLHRLHDLGSAAIRKEPKASEAVHSDITILSCFIVSINDRDCIGRAMDFFHCEHCY